MRAMWRSSQGGSAGRPASSSRSGPRCARTAAASIPATDTQAQKPSVSASLMAWCQRACAETSPASGITSPSRKTRMSWAAAATPVLRARASPNPRRSWRITFTASGVRTGPASGGSDPSSTTTTSSSPRGQACRSSPARVSASASGASKQGTIALTGSAGANAPGSGSSTCRQSLCRTAAGRGPGVASGGRGGSLCRTVMVRAGTMAPPAEAPPPSAGPVPPRRPVAPASAAPGGRARRAAAVPPGPCP